MLSSFRALALLLIVGLVSACAGTGTRETSEINALIQAADGNTAIVARNTGFAGSAPTVSVFMDGELVSSLGNNEVDSFQATPGQHELSIKFEGIDLGLETNTLTYVNDPKRTQFFVISLKQGFIGAKMTIAEVSPDSFTSAIR